MKKLTSLLLILVLMLGSCGRSPDKCTHKDDNDDGICESCDTSVIVTVDLYSINDLHGKLENSESDIGVDEMTTYLRTMAAVNEHSIFLSSGDMWQSASASNLTEGLIITDWMNELGFVSMTLGNHEYDWGEEPVKKNAEAAEFPLLGINVYDRDTNERVEYCEASVTVDLGKIQVGIIGAIGDCYSSISSDKVEDIYFKTGDALAELVTDEADRLRALGADLIVYSLHDGYGNSSSGIKNVTGTQLSSYYQSSLSRDGVVDVVFEGHSHQSYVLKDTYGVYHLQGGGDNNGLSHAEIGVNSITGSISVGTAEYVRESEYKTLDPDSVVDELLLKYDEVLSGANVVLGTNGANRNSSYLKRLVASLYYEYGMAKWGQEYDIVIGGGFLSVRSPYELERGDVTYAQLVSLLPFDNEIHLCSVSGSDLLSRFINTSNSDYYVYPTAVSDIDPNKTYYIVTDAYCSQYAPNRLTVIESYGADIFARDLVAEHIKNGGLE